MQQNKCDAIQAGSNINLTDISCYINPSSLYKLGLHPKDGRLWKQKIVISVNRDCFPTKRAVVLSHVFFGDFALTSEL